MHLQAQEVEEISQGILAEEGLGGVTRPLLCLAILYQKRFHPACNDLVRQSSVQPHQPSLWHYLADRTEHAMMEGMDAVLRVMQNSGQDRDSQGWQFPGVACRAGSPGCEGSWPILSGESLKELQRALRLHLSPKLVRVVLLGPLVRQRHEVDKLFKAEAPVVIPAR